MNLTNTIKQHTFGKLNDNTIVYNYILKNKNGIQMEVLNYGGIIRSLKVPDASGNFENIVLGFDSLDLYLKDPYYLGAIIGRYANRIANGRFSLDNQVYTLAQNEGKHHLHGGKKGLSRVIWNVTPIEKRHACGLELTYISHHMEEGYPGDLTLSILYLLTDENEFQIEYNAHTNKKTIINLTQHSYFNLSGKKQSILDHQVKLNANYYLPVDDNSIPTGEKRSVKNTPFDFNHYNSFQERILSSELKSTKGYDHSWVLNKEKKAHLEFAAKIIDPTSHRAISVYTTEPSIHLYTGNSLNNIFLKQGAFCLETQHFPNSPNQPSFPTVVLTPEENYFSKTVFQFSIK